MRKELSTGLVLSSVMFDGKLSASITVRKGRVATENFNAVEPTLSLWVNGGSSWDFNISRELADRLEDLSAVEQQAIARDIASKVSISIQGEITALELAE